MSPCSICLLQLLKHTHTYRSFQITGRTGSRLLSAFLCSVFTCASPPLPITVRLYSNKFAFFQSGWSDFPPFAESNLLHEKYLVDTSNILERRRLWTMLNQLLQFQQSQKRFIKYNRGCWDHSILRFPVSHLGYGLCTKIYTPFLEMMIFLAVFSSPVAKKPN